MADELTTTAQPVSMEMLRYKEELAEKMGLPSPYGMQLLKQTCQDMVDSGMVPKHFNGNPMAVYGAAMRGREMGLQPMEAVMETFWAAPGGRLGMYAAKMLDLMHRGHVTSKFLKEDAEGCEILFTPPGDHEPYTAKFYAAEAQTAGLVKPDSNWNKWRSDMNRARAISRGWRALLGTFKGGTANVYSKEEMEDSGLLEDEARRDSSTGEPSELDRKRAEQISAQTNPMGDYRVALKSKPIAEAAAEIATLVPSPVAVDPQPVPGLDTGTLDTGTTAAPPAKTPEPAQIVYRIHTLLRLASGGFRPIDCGAEPDFLNRNTAATRAQALANGSGEDHMLIQINRTTGVSSDDLILKAPVKPEPPAKPVAVPAPKPEAKDPKEKAAIVQRLEAIRQKVPNLPPKTFMARANTFCAEYLNVPAKQLNTVAGPLVQDALDALEEQIAQNAKQFEDMPGPAGQARRENYAAMREYLKDTWPGEALLQNLGLKMARMRGFTGETFPVWFTDPAIALHTLPVKPLQDAGKEKEEPTSQAEAYLRLALKAPKLAARLLRACRQHQLSIAMALDQIERRVLYGPVGQAEQGKVEQAIEAYLAAIEAEAQKELAQKEAAKQEAEKQAEPEPGSDPEPEVEPGLFSEFGG